MKVPSSTLTQKQLLEKYLPNDSNNYNACSLNTKKGVATRKPNLNKTLTLIVCIYYCNFLCVNGETPTQPEFNHVILDKSNSKNLYNYSINNIFPFKSDNFHNKNNDRLFSNFCAKLF